VSTTIDMHCANRQHSKRKILRRKRCDGTMAYILQRLCRSSLQDRELVLTELLLHEWHGARFFDGKTHGTLVQIVQCLRRIFLHIHKFLLNERRLNETNGARSFDEQMHGTWLIYVPPCGVLLLNGVRVTGTESDIPRRQTRHRSHRRPGGGRCSRRCDRSHPANPTPTPFAVTTKREPRAGTHAMLRYADRSPVKRSHSNAAWALDRAAPRMRDTTCPGLRLRQALQEVGIFRNSLVSTIS